MAATPETPLQGISRRLRELRIPEATIHPRALLAKISLFKNRLVAAGYNGFLPGAPHDSHVRDGHELARLSFQLRRHLDSVECFNER